MDTQHQNDFEASEPVVIKTEPELDFSDSLNSTESSSGNPFDAEDNDEEEEPLAEPQSSDKDDSLVCEQVPSAGGSAVSNLRNNFNCYLCSPVTQLDGKESLQQHLQTAHPVRKTYHCSECDKTVDHVSTYNWHLSRHDPVLRPYKCGNCPMRFSIARNKARHEAFVHRPDKRRRVKQEDPEGSAKKTAAVARVNFNCYICQPVTELSGKEALQQHLVDAHPRQDLYQCGECGFAIEKIVSFNAHLSRHDPNKRAHQCSVCLIRFMRRNTMLDHETQVHGIDHGRVVKKQNRSKERRFVCPTCGKRFPFESKLKVHQTTVHQSELTVAGILPEGFTVEYLKARCYICNPHFAVASRKDLLEHLKAVHPKQPVYPCGECSYSSKNLINFNSHLARHDTSNRPFKCSFCTIRFANRKERIRHELAAHDFDNGRETYTCQGCGKKFAYDRELMQHERSGFCGYVRTKVQKAPAVCQLCGKVVGRQWSLRRHHQLMHGSEMAALQEMVVKVENDDGTNDGALLQ